MTRNRRITQLGFVALTLVGVFVVRGNAERWCPFGGVEAIYTYVREGNLLCSLGVSNFYILGAVLLVTLLLRRAFCGYACPIGAISEWIQAGAKRFGIRPASVPYTLDRVLAKLKYVVLAIILYFTWWMAELKFRVADPCYVLISRHGEDITFWAYLVSGAIILASLFVLLPFCRWFCPLAAVMHPFSRLGLTRIKRDEEACTNCGACSRVCPTNIKVAELKQVTAARCISCLSCVDICPNCADGTLRWGPPGVPGRSWPQSVLIGTMLVCLTAAVAAAYVFPLPSFVKFRGEAPAQTATARLKISELTCRGKATLLWYFLDRDDDFAIPGYLKVDAWPGPGQADAHVTYDPSQADESRVKQAISEPYFDSETWRMSPFRITGYDPFDFAPQP